VQFQKKELTAIEDELKGRIASLLGSADTGTVNGDVAVTWKQQKRSSFDGKGLLKTHPDLYDEFTKISTYRVLRMKGEK
jgi:predicted phage-related endonuclease